MFLRLSLIQSSRFSAAPTCSIYHLHRMGVRCGMLLRLPQRKLIWLTSGLHFSKDLLSNLFDHFAWYWAFCMMFFLLSGKSMRSRVEFRIGKARHLARFPCFGLHGVKKRLADFTGLVIRERLPYGQSTTAPVRVALEHVWFLDFHHRE